MPRASTPASRATVRRPRPIWIICSELALSSGFVRLMRKLECRRGSDSGTVGEGGGM